LPTGVVEFVQLFGDSESVPWLQLGGKLFGKNVIFQSLIFGGELLGKSRKLVICRWFSFSTEAFLGKKSHWFSGEYV